MSKETITILKVISIKLTIANSILAFIAGMMFGEL